MDGDSVLTVVFFSVISGLLGYMALTHANELSVVISLLCAFISASTGIWLSRRIHMASLVDKTTSSGKKQHIALKDNRHIAVKSMEIFAQSSLMAVFMVTFALSAIMWTFSTEELSDPNPQTTRFYECQDGEVIWWESAGNGTGCTDGSDLSVSEEEWCGIDECDNLELRLERYTDRLGDVARNGFPLLLTAAVVPLVGMMYVPLYVLKHNPAMLEHQSLWGSEVCKQSDWNRRASVSCPTILGSRNSTRRFKSVHLRVGILQVHVRLGDVDVWGSPPVRLHRHLGFLFEV